MQNENLPNSEKIKCAKELLDNGFLKYAGGSRVDIYENENFKIAHIDAEELAEFSFGFFLPALDQILLKRDINLSAQKLTENDNSFDALINGDTIQLCTQNDLGSNTFWTQPQGLSSEK